MPANRPAQSVALPGKIRRSIIARPSTPEYWRIGNFMGGLFSRQGPPPLPDELNSCNVGGGNAPSGRLTHSRLSVTQPLEDRSRTRHREIPRLLVVRRAGIVHHEGVLNARKNMNLDVLHACRHGAEKIQYRRWRNVIAVAPDDADRLANAVELLNVILQLRAVAGYPRGIAEPLWAKNGIGAAVAKTHRRGFAVELRQCAQMRQRVFQ